MHMGNNVLSCDYSCMGYDMPQSFIQEARQLVKEARKAVPEPLGENWQFTIKKSPHMSREAVSILIGALGDRVRGYSDRGEAFTLVLNEQAFPSFQVDASIKEFKRKLESGWEKTEDGHFVNTQLVENKVIDAHYFTRINSDVESLFEVRDTDGQSRIVTDSKLMDLMEAAARFNHREKYAEYENAPLAGVRLTFAQMDQISTKVGFDHPAKEHGR